MASLANRRVTFDLWPFSYTEFNYFGPPGIKCRKRTDKIRMYNDVHEILGRTLRSSTLDEHGFILAGVAAFRNQGRGTVQRIS